MRTTKRQMREEKPDLDAMRYDLAEREAMNMSVSTIIEILLYGCDPLDLVENEEICEEWESIFGENG